MYQPQMQSFSFTACNIKHAIFFLKCLHILRITVLKSIELMSLFLIHVAAESHSDIFMSFQFYIFNFFCEVCVSLKF